jgi:uncharacterized protein (DUF58 family)
VTPRRAWALIVLAALALAATPWAWAAGLVAVAALAALVGLAALQARDTVREQRIAQLEATMRALAEDSKRVGEMWRAYQQGL